MYLEQEAYIFFVAGVALVVAAALAILAARYIKTRDKNLFWFGGQIAFLVLAACFFWQCLRTVPVDPMDTMYSERQSVPFAYMGICWAVSMLFEGIGILRMHKK